MDRLECFYVAAAHVLRRLLEVFPEPVFLDAGTLQTEIAKTYPECAALQAGPNSPGQNLFSWTIHFLIEEGFVRAGRDKGPAYPACRLTSLGLARLNRPFEVSEPQPTLGRRLIEAGKLIAPGIAGAIATRLFAA